MVIVVDTREKPRAIVKILSEFDRQGIEVVRRALDFADYFNPEKPDVVIDRKQNLLETANCCVQDRPRFMREVDRCNRAGCHMIVLIEHSPQIRRLEDVIRWNNPRLKVSPLAVSGDRLFRIMKAMEIKYGIQWEFCGKAQTGKRIIELLRSDQDAK